MRTARARIVAGLLAVALGAPLATSCTRAHAKVTPEVPPLEVPPPPPRVVEPTETETPPPVPLVKEPARHTNPQAPRQTHPAESPRPEVKPEPAKPEAAPAPEPPKTEAPQPPPVTTLQTTPAEAEGEVERSIRGVLDRARGDLGRVDYGRLNKDARNQYDTAKRFVQQADDALRAKNLVFAKYIADKAATIAAQLAGR